MFAANQYAFRFATIEDEHRLRHLAGLEHRPPVRRPALVGLAGGTSVGATPSLAKRIRAAVAAPGGRA